MTTWLKHSQCAIKSGSIEGTVSGMLQEAKSHYFGGFILESYFYMTGILSRIFTLITNHNQFDLIEFYENFHLEWPFHESEFISQQRSQDQKWSLISGGSRRRLQQETELYLQLNCHRPCPPGFSEVVKERMLLT